MDRARGGPSVGNDWRVSGVQREECDRLSDLFRRLNAVVQSGIYLEAIQTPQR